MRKIWKLTLIAILGVIVLCAGGAKKAEAGPWGVMSGYVNPNAGIVTVNGGTTTFSLVDYSFSVDEVFTTGATMNGLYLYFENDVFTNIGTFNSSSLNPDDWSYSSSSGGSGPWEIALTGGTTIGLGQTLSFSVEDVVVFTDALTDPEKWDEGGIWEQTFVAESGRDGDGDGDVSGSTELVPEPGTIALLGIGLAGLVGVGVRRRMRMKKKVD